MARPTKEYEALNIKMRKGVHVRLESFCKRLGITKTAAVEEAVEAYISPCIVTGWAQALDPDAASAAEGGAKLEQLMDESRRLGDEFRTLTARLRDDMDALMKARDGIGMLDRKCFGLFCSLDKLYREGLLGQEDYAAALGLLDEAKGGFGNGPDGIREALRTLDGITYMYGRCTGTEPDAGTDVRGAPETKPDVKQEDGNDE